MKYEIKNRWSNELIFSADVESMKACLLAAIKSGADLRSAYLRSADLRSADLRSADLRSAYLRSADLRSADLRSADLRSADLSDADLSGAYLSGADLSGADLRSANLSGADLSGATGINKHLTTPLFGMLDITGTIRGYKLVNGAMEGPMNGGIRYAIGESFEVKDACVDEFTQCGAGINLASLDWVCREWRPGYKILIAEFEKADIASIPVASDGKFRVFRCKIVA